MNFLVFVCSCLIIQAMSNFKFLEETNQYPWENEFLVRVTTAEKLNRMWFVFRFSIWNLLYSLSHFFIFLLCPILLDYDQHVTNWLKQKQKQKWNSIQRSLKRKYIENILAETHSNGNGWWRWSYYCCCCCCWCWG